MVFWISSFKEKTFTRSWARFWLCWRIRLLPESYSYESIPATTKSWKDVICQHRMKSCVLIQPTKTKPWKGVIPRAPVKYVALSGLSRFGSLMHRVLPYADVFRPFGTLILAIFLQALPYAGRFRPLGTMGIWRLWRMEDATSFSQSTLLAALQPFHYWCKYQNPFPCPAFL